MERYVNIWLIVPLLCSQEHELLIFIKRHSVFFNNGGRAILKVSGSLENKPTKLLQDENIHLIQKPDSSLYEAWNQSLDYLESIKIKADSYVAFLGLDDTICYKFCDVATRFSGLDIDFIYGDIYSELGQRFRRGRPALQPLLFNNYNEYVFDVFHPGMMNRWKSISSFRFDESFQLAADLDFYIRVSKSQNINSQYIGIIQAIVGADGISNSVVAKYIYMREWVLIENKLGVKILKKSTRTTWLIRLSSVPIVYNIVRKIYWGIVGKKNIEKC